MKNRRAMTGRPVEGLSDAIWDDGEWISWEWINGQLYEQEIKETYPDVDPEIVMIFEGLVQNAKEYQELTGRHLSIFGELGELFAEIRFGIERHKPGVPGSDGRLGNDFVEVKTISPEKISNKVMVKRKGNFSKLVVVKISEDYEFEARMLDRKNISKGTGKYVTVSWSSMKPKQI